MMIGIDEVGRGCWAGPLLVVAARQNIELSDNVTDSKALNKQKRQNLVVGIQQACDLGFGWVQSSELDSLGLTESMKLAVSRALDEIGALSDEIIIMDGHINYCTPNFIKVQTVIKADGSVPVVGAASIIAKVTRDMYMSELDDKYSNYEFDKHVGYGTARHKALLMQYGVSDIHRKSFKPIKELLT